MDWSDEVVKLAYLYCVLCPPVMSREDDVGLTSDPLRLPPHVVSTLDENTCSGRDPFCATILLRRRVSSVASKIVLDGSVW